jgi:hypothetical protein
MSSGFLRGHVGCLGLSSVLALLMGACGGESTGPAGEAYVVWTDRRSGGQDIYFARSSEFRAN